MHYLVEKLSVTVLHPLPLCTASLSFFVYSMKIYFFCSFAGGWIIVFELYPGFSLYRGLYEFAQYSFNGNYLGTDGMKWSNLSDSKNGMKEVMIIMFVEWLLLLFVAYYVDQIASSGNRKSPLYFLQNLGKKKRSASMRVPSLQKQGSNKVFVDMEKPDVLQEVIFFYLTHFTSSVWFTMYRKIS